MQVEVDLRSQEGLDPPARRRADLPQARPALADDDRLLAVALDDLQRPDVKVNYWWVSKQQFFHNLYITQSLLFPGCVLPRARE